MNAISKSSAIFGQQSEDLNITQLIAQL
jgi:hypothetical protein